MFMTHSAPPNGLDPGDKMPGTASSIFDEMDALMSDWSWRGRQTDPGYVYTEAERTAWALFRGFGVQLPAVRPWSFPAYRGPAVRPTRIGVTR